MLEVMHYDRRTRKITTKIYHNIAEAIEDLGHEKVTVTTLKKKEVVTTK